MIYENEPFKSKFFGVKDFFTEILIPKMSMKMNSSLIMKKYAADPEKRFPKKYFSTSIRLTCPFRQRGS